MKLFQIMGRLYQHLPSGGPHLHLRKTVTGNGKFQRKTPFIRDMESDGPIAPVYPFPFRKHDLCVAGIGKIFLQFRQEQNVLQRITHIFRRNGLSVGPPKSLPNPVRMTPAGRIDRIIVQDTGQDFSVNPAVMMPVPPVFRFQQAGFVDEPEIMAESRRYLRQMQLPAPLVRLCFIPVHILGLLFMPVRVSRVFCLFFLCSHSFCSPPSVCQKECRMQSPQVPFLPMNPPCLTFNGTDHHALDEIFLDERINNGNRHHRNHDQRIFDDVGNPRDLHL